MSTRKVALVTGAASGMGLALTKQLIERGYKVAMCDLNAEAGERYASEFGQESAAFFKTDLSSYEDQAAAFQAMWRSWERLDFVAVNGGILDSSNLYATEPLDGDQPPPKPNLKALDVNTNGAIYTVYLAVSYMARNSANSGGKITITASAVALYPLDSMPAYSASKAAIPGLVRSMARRLKSQNITINCLCPGLVSTGITSKVQSLIPDEYFTPMSTIIKAHDRFIDGEDTGCVAEVSKDNIYIREQIPYADKYQEWIDLNLGEIGRRARAGGAARTG